MWVRPRARYTFPWTGPGDQSRLYSLGLNVSLRFRQSPCHRYHWGQQEPLVRTRTFPLIHTGATELEQAVWGVMLWRVQSLLRQTSSQELKSPLLSSVRLCQKPNPKRNLFNSTWAIHTSNLLLEVQLDLQVAPPLSTQFAIRNITFCLSVPSNLYLSSLLTNQLFY